MFTDFYLTFPDEATANSVLCTTYEITPEVVEPDGTIIPAVTGQYQNYLNISTLGIVYHLPLTNPPVPYDGWGVNVRCLDNEDASALQPYAIEITNPQRIWAT